MLDISFRRMPPDEELVIHVRRCVGRVERALDELPSWTIHVQQVERLDRPAVCTVSVASILRGGPIHVESTDTDAFIAVRDAFAAVAREVGLDWRRLGASAAVARARPASAA